MAAASSDFLKSLTGLFNNLGGAVSGAGDLSGALTTAASAAGGNPVTSLDASIAAMKATASTLAIFAAESAAKGLPVLGAALSGVSLMNALQNAYSEYQANGSISQSTMAGLTGEVLGTASSIATLLSVMALGGASAALAPEIAAVALGLGVASMVASFAAGALDPNISRTLYDAINGVGNQLQQAMSGLASNLRDQVSTGLSWLYEKAEHFIDFHIEMFDSLSRASQELFNRSPDLGRERREKLDTVRRERLTAENIFDTVISPLILDLDGNGVQTLSIARSVHFDHDGNGFAEATGWVGSGDGLLALDRNGNGKIDSGAELFGNYTRLPSGSRASNGFAALDALDSNRDGRITAADAAYAQLVVWKDVNANGITDDGELIGLQQAGVAEISTAYETSNKIDGQNNERRQLGQFTRMDGSWGQVHDVWFKRDTVDDGNTPFSPVAIPEDIQALPNIQGFGGVRDLQDAMTLDPTLKGLVESFYAQPLTERPRITDEIIMRWTGADQVRFGIDSPYYDERKLFAIDIASGEQAYDRNYNERPAAGPQAAGHIDAGYNALHEYVYWELSRFQAAPLERLNDLSYLLDWNGQQVFRLAAYQERKQADPEGAIVDLLQVVQIYGSALFSRGWDGYAFLKQESQALAGNEQIQQTLRSWNLFIGSGELRPAASVPAIVFAGAGNDTLYGSQAVDLLDGGQGDDLYWSEPTDFVYFGVGSGHDRSIGAASVVFQPAVRPEDVTLQRTVGAANTQDLLITLASGDTLSLESFFQVNSASYAAPSVLRFADGTTWGLLDIQDRLVFPGSGNDVVSGLDGNDFLAGYGGSDTLYGGGGNDVLSGGNGDDWVNGGNGQDVLIGGAGNDYLIGSNNTEYLEGGKGNDTLSGDGGSDTYFFNRGDGRDTIYDFNQSAVGSDTLVFGPGINPEDVLITRSDADLLLSLPGTSDSVRIANWFQQQSYQIESVVFDNGTVWAPKDLLSRLTAPGSDGADSLMSLDGGGSLYGLAGNDTLMGGNGADYLEGGSGNDVLESRDGLDTLVGGRGDDTLQGGAGGDTYIVQPLDGSDVIYDSHYDRGEMNQAGVLDTLRVAALPTEVTLWAGGYENGSLFIGLPDQQNRVEVFGWFDQNDNRTLQIEFADGTIWDAASINSRVLFVATGGADTLYGSAAADTLVGLAGDDHLIANNGNDVLDGGAGNDTLKGGGGSDTYVFGFGYGQDFILEDDWSAEGLVSVDTVRMAQGVLPSDVVLSNDGSRIVLSLQGGSDQLTIDQMWPSQRVERVVFADGTVWDLASNPNGAFSGTSGADNIAGSNFDDFIDGRAGGDSISGGAGNDTLIGGDGNDTLSGGDGANVLDGGAGADSLYASSGDRVRFGYGSGQDILYRSYDAKGTIEFSPGVRPEDVRLTPASNGTLRVSLTGSADRLDIWYWFNANNQANSFNRFEFSDGTVWLLDDIAQRIDNSGTPGVDYLTGFARADSLSGQGGNDVLAGFGGNDLLDGGAGNDSVDGGSGDDVLIGGAGNDTLYGGSGSDSYLFSAGFGQDTIVENGVYEAGSANRVSFQAGISSSQILVTGDNEFTPGSEGNLYLTVLGTGDKLTLSRWFDNYRSNVDFVEFADGTVWNRADLLAKFYSLERGGTMSGTSLSDALLGDDTNDRIEGFGGADVISGTGGDDTLIGDEGADTLDGGTGDDFLLGGVGDDTYRFDSGFGHDTIADYDRVTGGTDRVVFGPGLSSQDVRVTRTASDIVLAFGDGRDTLTIRWYANSGMHVEQLLFGDGTVWTAEQLQALADASAQISGTAGDDSLKGTAEPDFMDGGAGNDTLSGGRGDDRLNGGTGNDVLDGGAGEDTLIGGRGDDFYVVNLESDVVVEFADEGNDSVEAHASFTLQDNIESLTLRGDGINGTGNAQANILVGSAGTNALRGLSGDDTLEGGGGNDLLTGGLGSDSYRFSAGWGIDVIDDLQRRDASQSGVDLQEDGATDQLVFDASVQSAELRFSILDSTDLLVTRANSTDAVTVQGYFGSGGRIEQIVFADGTSLSFEQVLDIATTVSGTDGDDVLSAVSAASKLYGGSGNDSLYGGDWDDLLDGGLGIDSLDGGYGNDTYVVDDGGDVVVERSGQGQDRVLASISYTLGSYLENLTLVGTAAINGTGNSLANELRGNGAANRLAGGAGNDTLLGADGSDTLDGGTGVDDLEGGAGDDSYVVENIGDVIIESLNEGIDSVSSSVSYSLGSHIEKLTLTGSSGISGTGNELDNVLVGNSVGNALTAGAGNDSIDGGAGNDTMRGGSGDDLYYVNATGDVVTENANEGIDLVSSAVTWTLGSNLENLTLTGASAINGTGNSLNNALVGNSAINTLTGGAGNDTLDGLGGADKLIGGTGDDVYYVDNVADVITENASEGIDLVRSSQNWTLGSNLENLELLGNVALNATGNSLNNLLRGNVGANNLSGAAGNDTLDGGAGADTLAGGTGADLYLFGRGYGVDSVQENDSTAGVKDRLQFGQGITTADATFQQNGNNLEVLINGTADKLVIQNWYLGTQYHIEEFAYADGTALTDAQVQGGAGSMAVAKSETSAVTDHTATHGQWGLFARRAQALISSMAAFAPGDGAGVEALVESRAERTNHVLTVNALL